MTDTDLQQLSSYIDGELTAVQNAELEQRLASDSSLQMQLRALQRVNRQFIELAGKPDPAHVPAAVSALLKNPQYKASQQAKILPFPVRHRRTLSAGMALAASLVLALTIGFSGQNTNISDEPGQDNTVATALDNITSSADEWTPLADNRQLRAVLSFANNEGQWCREYQLRQDASQWRGVACRNENGWQDALLLKDNSLPANTANYQPAGAGDVDVIGNYIDTHSVDIPLSAAQEAEVIARKWQ